MKDIFSKYEDYWSNSSFCISTSIFIRLLGIIYLIAFISILPYLDSVFNIGGLVESQNFFESVNQNFSYIQSLINFPSIFQFNCSNEFILLTLYFAIFSSIILIVGYFQKYNLIICWFLFLSFCIAGGALFKFQQDYLLLEIGFISIFLLSFKWRISIVDKYKPQSLIVFLFRLLLFKVLFFSGVSKLSQENWLELSALQKLFEVQPSINSLSLWFHTMPDPLLKLGNILVLIMELIIPFLLFAIGPVAAFSAILIIFYQFIIFFTGGHGIENLLVISIALMLLDDKFWKEWSLLDQIKVGVKPKLSRWQILSKRAIQAMAMVYIIVLSTQLLVKIEFLNSLPKSLKPIDTVLRNFRIANDYSFGNYSLSNRKELIYEISFDGNVWTELITKPMPTEYNVISNGNAPFVDRLHLLLWQEANKGSLEEGTWLKALDLSILRQKMGVLSFFHDNLVIQQANYVRRKMYIFSLPKSYSRNKSQFWNRRLIKDYGIFSLKNN